MSPVARGFTLAELLCVLAIIALLAACAVPMHRAASMRARRTDARIALLHVASLQQRHLFENGRYAATLADLGLGETPRSAEGFYHLDVRTAARDQAFTAIAVPAPGGPQQADRDCTSLRLDDVGRRTATGSADADRRCWS